MEAQRRFIADAAHEMRSPLTALLLQVQNLEQSAPISLSGRIKPLKEGIVRTCQLVEQLLSHARSQVGSTQWVPVSCFQLGRTLVSDLMPLAEARHMDLGLECPENLEVISDPQLLPLILRNALDNALRYAPEGS
ncbi:integral membrane sensor signal transduction histidine kinase, partial [mine drainage metagenome]